MKHYFFDADMSWRLSNMISALEDGIHEVIHITQDQRFSHNNNKYGNNTPDIEWLNVLGKDSVEWTAISGDTNIIDTAHERAALVASGITFFAFDDHFSNSQAYDQAFKLIRMWPDIIRHSAISEPAIYLIRTGKRPGIEKIKGGMRARGGRL
jgi:hypothetical protein